MSYETVDEAMTASVLAVNSWEAAKALKENAHGLFVRATMAEEDARIEWERSRNDVIHALLIERRDLYLSNAATQQSTQTPVSSVRPDCGDSHCHRHG